jgi:hypothetical protein
MRPVRRLSSPSGVILGSKFSWASIAHQELVIGDPNDNDGVVTSELRRIDGSKVEQCTLFHVRLSSSRAKQLNEATIMGYTSLSNLEIEQKAMEVINGHNDFHLLRRNCQHFATNLAHAIIDPSIIEPDPYVQYVFTKKSLRFMESFDFSSSRAGWILPNPETILINVTTTQDEDTWLGEVEGSRECGKFLRNAVERK